jgi:hypothetical protein
MDEGRKFRNVSGVEERVWIIAKGSAIIKRESLGEWLEKAIIMYAVKSGAMTDAMVKRLLAGYVREKPTDEEMLEEISKQKYKRRM